MFGLIIMLLFIIFDFVISVWNAYSSGYNIALLRKNRQGGFQKVASYAGLGLAFAGMAYVVLSILSILAYYLGYISYNALGAVLGLNFLVFGILIIGFGFIITIQSIIIAYKRRSIGSILISLYNIFAEAFDIESYLSGFQESVQIVRRGENEEGDILILVVVALLIAFFIIHAAYRHGLAKGSNA
jgi:hypothetical protein